MAARRGRSQRRFRILPSILLTVVILLLPVGVYIWGRYAGAFRVQRVVLSGTQRVPAKRALTLLSTRYRGRNLFTISRADVLGQLHVYPYFRTARVDRDFPDTLRVSVTEYRPAACLLADGRWYVVTADGYVIMALRRPAGSASATSSASHTSSASSGALSTTGDSSGTGAASTAATAATASTAATTTTATAATTGTPSTTTTTATATTGTTTGTSSAKGPTAADAAAQAKAAADHAAAVLAATLVAGPPVPPKPRLPAVFTLAPVVVRGRISDPQLLASLAVIGTLPAALSREAAYVRVNVAGNVRVYLRSGLKVDFGDDARLGAKMLALNAVLVFYTQRHVTPTYVDVSVPDRPLATPLLST